MNKKYLVIPILILVLFFAYNVHTELSNAVEVKIAERYLSQSPTMGKELGRVKGYEIVEIIKSQDNDGINYYYIGFNVHATKGAISLGLRVYEAQECAGYRIEAAIDNGDEKKILPVDCFK